MSLEPKPADPMVQGWWWFDKANVSEKCEAALAWETLRRTSSYTALWRKWQRLSLNLFNDRAKPGRDLRFQFIHLFQRSRQAIGQPYFDFWMHGFDPALSWLQLTEEQRLTAKGCVVHKQTAVKTAPALLLPRQTAASAFVASIRCCEISRTTAKKLRVSRLIRGGEDLEKVAPLKFFQKLRPKTPAQYLYVYFDTRLGREPVLAAVRAEKQFWTPDPHSGSRLKSGQVCVIPANEPPFAIFLAPATCDKTRLLAALHTQLKASRRQKWFPRCVAHWKTLTMQTTELLHNPDSTIQSDSKGFPLRRRVIRPSFDPDRHLPSKEAPHKSATRRSLWLGLAANDVVRKKRSLSNEDPDVTFLLKETESWSSWTSSKTPDWRRRRKSLEELRNHQKSAKRRLMELGAQMGRLDKTLDRCIKENAKLSGKGFFGTVGPQG